MISWCDFCYYLPLLAVAGEADISRNPCAAKDPACFRLGFRSSPEGHGMQGVRSSSLLGSILKIIELIYVAREGYFLVAFSIFLFEKVLLFEGFTL